jgi:hypothetical protein
MVAPVKEPDQPERTRLYFGSAVLPRRGGAGKAGEVSEKLRMGWMFYVLLGFHRLYSRLLLAAASRRLACAGTTG